MKRILSFALSIAIVIASFGVSTYSNQKIVTAEPVSWPSGPGTVAETAILMEASTGTILYEKKCHKQMYPASITKIMTALLTIENCNLDDTVTFSQSAIDSLEYEAANVGALVGEEMSVKDCLYALMLHSANEVATALGEHISGDINSFADLMNERAKQAGATDTHFVNANGLFNEKHHVTAYDMAKIMQAALQYPVFREIINSTNYTLQKNNKRKEKMPIGQRHKMVLPWESYYYKGIIGGKTGYVDQSGTTLVTSAERNGMTLIVVVLNSPNVNSYKDTTALFDFGFENFKLENISKHETRFADDSSITTQFTSIFNTKQERLYIPENDQIVLPKKANIEDTTSSIQMNTDETSNNNVVATISYSYGDTIVGTSSVLYGKTADTVNATVATDAQQPDDTPLEIATSISDSSSIAEPETTKKVSASKSKSNTISVIIKVLLITIVLLFIAGILLFIKKKYDKLNEIRASKRRRNR